MADPIKIKITGIFLLFIFIIPVTCTFSWLNHQKKLIKKEVKRQIIKGLNRNELVLLKFSDKEALRKLHWRHSKEFMYNDQMYDVVESRLVNDSVYYWCWWDHEETKLNKRLNELLVMAMGNNPKTREKQESLLSYLKSFYYKDSPIRGKTFPDYSIKQFYLHSELFSSVYISPPTPPPRAA